MDNSIMDYQLSLMENSLTERIFVGTDLPAGKNMKIVNKFQMQQNVFVEIEVLSTKHRNSFAVVWLGELNTQAYCVLTCLEDESSELILVKLRDLENLEVLSEQEFLAVRTEIAKSISADGRTPAAKAEKLFGEIAERSIKT